MAGFISYRAVLTKRYGPEGIWGIREGYQEFLTQREWEAVQRKGYLRVLQGHGIWSDIPREYWRIFRRERESIERVAETEIPAP